MKITEVKIGAIVVVVEGAAFGNSPGTITKILSKPGAVNDRVMKAIGTRYPEPIVPLVMCEKRSGIVTDLTPRYLNKLATHEHFLDLRPATEEEKKQYRKSKTKGYE